MRDELRKCLRIKKNGKRRLTFVPFLSQEWQAGYRMTIAIEKRTWFSDGFRKIGSILQLITTLPC